MKLSASFAKSLSRNLETVFEFLSEREEQKPISKVYGSDFLSHKYSSQHSNQYSNQHSYYCNTSKDKFLYQDYSPKQPIISLVQDNALFIQDEKSFSQKILARKKTKNFPDLYLVN